MSDRCHCGAMEHPRARAKEEVRDYLRFARGRGLAPESDETLAAYLRTVEVYDCPWCGESSPDCECEL